MCTDVGDLAAFVSGTTLPIEMWERRSRRSERRARIQCRAARARGCAARPFNQHCNFENRHKVFDKFEAI